MRAVPYDHPDAAKLVAGLQLHYVDVYGEEDTGRVDPVDFLPPHGRFFVGYLGNIPVVSGGWRAKGGGEFGLQDGDAELKRAYIAPEVTGLEMVAAASAILVTVEEDAARAGRTRAVLDAGIKQLAAIKFFERAGYLRIPNYGAYRDDPMTVCYAKTLSEVPDAAR